MANRQEIIVSQKGAEKTARGIGKVDKSIAGLTTSALGYAAAAGAVVAVAKKTIEAYGEQERAEKKLETALGHTNQTLLAQASALQKVSSHGDEAIIATQALISNMGIAENQIGDATEMAIGLSAALGVDLNMAAKAAAGAIQGDTNMLTRYIPLLKTTTDQTEKLSIVQGVANKGLRQAAADTKTVSGQMNQAKMAVGDAAEAIGKTLAPAVKEMAEGVTLAAQVFGDWMAQFEYQNDTIESSADSLKRIQAEIAMYKSQQEELTEESDYYAVLTEKITDLTFEYVGVLNELNHQKKKEYGTASEINTARSQNITLLGEEIQLMEEQAGIVNDLSYNFDDLTAITDQYVDAMVAATVNGQNMEDALISASKAITIQLVADWIKQKIASSTLLATTTAETIASAQAIASAWATPASLAATATAGGAAVAGGIALAAGVAESKAIAAFAGGGDFITDGPELILVGDNSTGREHVSVTPLGGDSGGGGGVTINVMGDFIGNQDFVEQTLIPAINLATAQGRASIA